jgi:hypothetical protein
MATKEKLHQRRIDNARKRKEKAKRNFLIRKLQRKGLLVAPQGSCIERSFSTAKTQIDGITVYKKACCCGVSGCPIADNYYCLD